ncbi:hypothetical protein [Gordonia humi]
MSRSPRTAVTDEPTGPSPVAALVAIFDDGHLGHTLSRTSPSRV